MRKHHVPQFVPYCENRSIAAATRVCVSALVQIQSARFWNPASFYPLTYWRAGFVKNVKRDAISVNFLEEPPQVDPSIWKPKGLTRPERNLSYLQR